LQGLCYGFAGGRRRHASPDAGDGAAELRRAAGGAGDLELRIGDHRCGGAGVPRPRRPRAHAGMGHHAGRCAQIPRSRTLGRGDSLHRDLHHRARLQPDGRRAARRPRSEAEALMALVEIRNLNVTFTTARGLLHAVENLDLTLEEGELLGIVGESGSGKSVTMLALMGLIPWPGKVTADRLTFDGKDILK